MQDMHFQVKTIIYFIIFDIMVKRNQMWLYVVCTFVDNDTYHHSGQNVVQQIELHHKACPLL